MALTGDFATTNVSGSMWDFHDAEGTQADGSVQLNCEMTGHATFEAAGEGTLD